MRYRTTVLSAREDVTGLELPAEVLDALGAGKRPVLRVTVGDHTWSTTPGSMGGKTMITLSKANRSAACVVAGEDVDVDVEVDRSPPVAPLPDDLAAAVDAAGARAFFDGLAPSHRKEWVRWVQEAKQEQTRSARIARAAAALAAGKARR